jgi:hypothetical protein
MKEHYQAFITASFLFFSAEKAGEAVLRFSNDYGGVAAYYFIVGMAFVLILRGLYMLLPYPLSGEGRDNFDKAVPEAYLKTRSERVLLYTRWKKNSV